MKIRMVTTAAGPGGVWPAGSVQDLDAERAEALIAGQFAVSVPLASEVRAGAVERPADEDSADDERPEQRDEEAAGTRRRKR